MFAGPSGLPIFRQRRINIDDVASTLYKDKVPTGSMTILLQFPLTILTQ